MPRSWFTRSDSCGLSIAGEVSSAVFTGWAGLLMSSTTTPSPLAACISVSFGKNKVES